jgi:hypothetical protein
MIITCNKLLVSVKYQKANLGNLGNRDNCDYCQELRFSLLIHNKYLLEKSLIPHTVLLKSTQMPRAIHVPVCPNPYQLCTT